MSALANGTMEVDNEPRQRRHWSDLSSTVPAVRTLHDLDLDVTEACNLACVYCFKWQKKAVHMDEDTAKDAIDWLIASSGKNEQLKVNLMGGEPLLRFDLIRKIVPYGKLRARQCGKSLHFGCTTNCTTLTDEKLEFWRHFGMGFHCSIDGIPEVQDANRPLLGGGGSSGAIEQNVPKILAYRPDVMARATVTPFSAPSLEASARYLAGLGFRSMTFKIAANCDWSATDFAILRTEYDKLAAFYLSRLTKGERLRIDEFETGIRALHSAKGHSKYPCGAGRGVALVDPRGDLWPCHRFGPHQCAGQFCFGKLGGPFNDRLRSVFLDYNSIRDGQAACSHCPAASTCRDWCYAECVECTGSLYDPGSVHCDARKIVHDQILHIDDHLRSQHPDLLRSVLK